MNLNAILHRIRTYRQNASIKKRQTDTFIDALCVRSEEDFGTRSIVSTGALGEAYLDIYGWVIFTLLERT